MNDTLWHRLNEWPVERRKTPRDLQTGDVWKELGYAYDPAVNQWKAPIVLAHPKSVDKGGAVE